MDADDPSVGTASSSDDTFFDALDSLPSPSPSPTPPPSSSAPPPHTPSSSTLRRRPRRAKSLKQPDSVLSPSPSASAATSTVTAVEDEPLKPDSSEATSAAPRTVPASEVVEEEEEEEHNKATDADADVEVEARAPTPTPSPSPAPSILEYLAVLVIKAVVFQVSALISCLAFPVRLLQWWFLFVTDPLGLARRARAWALGVAGDAVGTLAARLGGGEGVGKVAQRIVWGSLWAAYVCVVLCALLIMAFVGGGLLVGRIVEEPVQVTETLNFDYTKPSPMALVPVPRLVPPNQRMQLGVSLTLPESDYNRRLGVFQVLYKWLIKDNRRRMICVFFCSSLACILNWTLITGVKAEFLSADGKVISTSSQPCMLKFKSAHMHFIETFLQSVSLLSGYSSESQVIRLKMRGITLGLEPTTAVRIILEQRAEFGHGAGIPEIYAASLKLEAELPIFKRLLWNWRWTLFVWSSMGFFVFELLFALVCCRPCIFPRSGHIVAAP